ncbi:unnamed protein product, partial [Nesidiocoris tenuis]
MGSNQICIISGSRVWIPDHHWTYINDIYKRTSCGHWMSQTEVPVSTYRREQTKGGTRLIRLLQRLNSRMRVEWVIDHTEDETNSVVIQMTKTRKNKAARVPPADDSGDQFSLVMSAGSRLTRSTMFPVRVVDDPVRPTLQSQLQALPILKQNKT